MVLAPAAVFDEKNPVDNALAKAHGGPIKSGADLNGKIVAVTTLNGVGSLLLRPDWTKRARLENRMSGELPNPEMGAALKSGRIEAARFP